MANGLGSLFVGSSGLRSAQDAINNVANNLANVNTKGYVRQQVVFRDKEYNTYSYSKDLNKQLIGLGTSIGEIEHVRDIFLDKAYRTENGRQAYYAASFEAVDEVQTYFQELEGSAFQDILTGEKSLWQAFQELEKDPSDTVNQNLVIQKANLFVSRAQAVFDGLKDYQVNINTQISDDIDKINELGKKIYQYNIDIQRIESGGHETAMNERDARDYAIDEMSKYGKVDYKENVDGTLWLKFEGVLMADDMFYHEIGKQYDLTTGYITPYWPYLSNESAGKYYEVLDFTREINTENDTDIGELKALVQARGTTVSNFNNLNNADPDVYDSTIGLSVMQNSQAEFDNLIHGIVTAINDLLGPNIEVDGLVVRNGDGTCSKFDHIKVLDADNCSVGADGKKPPQELFTRIGCDRYKEVTARVWDEEAGDWAEDWKTYYIFNPEDVNDSSEIKMYGSSYRYYDMEKNTTVETGTLDLVTGKFQSDGSGRKPWMPWNKEDNEKYTKEYVNGNLFYILNDSYKYDEGVQYTSDSININENLKKQVTNLAYINPEREVDYTLAKKLTDIWNQDFLQINPRFSTTYSFGNYYQEMVGEIGIIGSMYNTTAESLKGAVDSVENRRSQVLGVSSDEELTKMIKYQNAYNASSRYIQTVSDMIEALIMGLGA